MCEPAAEYYMNWPTNGEYCGAIQKYQQTLADKELRAGKLATNAMGMPVTWSGNFAVVYKIHCPSTGNTWALKCFTCQIPNVQQRYQKISEHLRNVRFGYKVPFFYLEKGILVDGQWYPGVKMRWVEGRELHKFLKHSLDDAASLRWLLKTWLKVADRLWVCNIAHGDLQHANILVQDGSASRSLRLVDYDGMWVPKLVGTRSHECGHPAFQHPQRLAEGTYDPTIDRFSQLVVYTSVYCLMLGGRPLWDKYHNGDNLLFTKEDFKQPAGSELFRQLWELDDDGTKALVGRLALACTRPIECVPALSDVVGNKGQVQPLDASDYREAKLLFGERLIVAVPGDAAQEELPKQCTQPWTRRLSGSLLRCFRWLLCSARKIVAEIVASIGARWQSLRSIRTDGKWVLSLAFSTDGRWIVTTAGNRTARLWDSSTGRLLHSFGRHVKPITCVAFSPAGDMVATGCEDGTAALWATETGKRLATFPGHTQAILSIGFSPDASRMVTGSADNTAKVWHVEKISALKALEGHSEAISCVAYSPEGRNIATGSWDRTAKVWDAQTGEELSTLVGHSAQITSLAYCPNGRKIATGSDDGAVKIWDLDTGKELVSLDAHAAMISSVAFSPDGNRIVTGSWDKTVKLWNTQTGSLHLSLEEHACGVLAVAFSPDGRRVWVGYTDGATKVVPLH